MNHDDATKSLAAERYILGELNESERDAFEEHFFDCVLCAEEVRDTATFAAGVRTGGATVAAPAKYITRWAAAAGAAIAVALSYQYGPQLISRLNRPVPHPRGQQARVATSEQPIELDSARSVATVYSVRRDQPVALYFIIPPPEAPLPSYACELQDAAGRKIAAASVLQQQALNTVRMPVKAGAFRTGDYKLVIRGGDREIAAYPFNVEVR